MIKENTFGGKRLFTTAEPADYKIKKLSVNEFARSTERFLNEGFRGAINITIDKDTFGYVEISVYGFAYLTKLVLSKIYGNRMLMASMHFTRQSVVFSIDFGTEADESDISDTVYAAKRCGLECEQDGARLNFSARVTQSQILPLYACDSVYSLSIYNEVFYYGSKRKTQHDDAL